MTHVRGAVNMESGVESFPELSAEPRTDSNFRSRQFPDHHIGTTMSPILQLSCDMAKNFPLDYMHLVCLGVVCRLFVFVDMWTEIFQTVTASVVCNI